MIQRALNRIWHSATFMTWGSHTARILGLIVVMPLILTRFPTEVITLWYLFVTIIGLQSVVDFGFITTFARVIAYGMGGVRELSDFRQITATPGAGKPNWDMVGSMVSTMRSIYRRLTLILVVFLGFVGTLALLRPIGQVETQSEAWIAWGVILVTSAITFRVNMYSAYLQGVNEIALLRRWEALTLLGAAATSILVLLLNGSLLALVIASESWVIVRVLRNRWLSRLVHGGRFKSFTGAALVPQVFSAVWPAAWRSGLGLLMARGTVEASGLVFAQLGSSAVVASYLIALRVIQTINRYSEAPFYTKLPILARLYVEGNLNRQVQVAQNSMKYAFWTFVLGFITVGILAEPLLGLIRSNADFVSPLLWTLMGLAFFIGRYGAMHLHFYSITNHIIWHIANGVSGLIYISLSVVLYPFIGVYAFPVGMIGGSLGFYSWYSAMHSHRAFKYNKWWFNRSTVVFPASVLLLYIAVMLYFSL